MRANTQLALLILFCTTTFGCDGTDLNNDEEKLVGKWAVLGVRDHTGDLTQQFKAEMDEATFEFDEDKNLKITLDYSTAGEAAGYTDRVLTGSFSLDADQRVFRIVFSGTGGTFESLYYRFEGESFFNFAGPVNVLNPLFGGTPKVGIVEFSFGRR